MTPLFYALASGQADTVKVLLEAGADLETKNVVSERVCMYLYVHACIYVQYLHFRFHFHSITILHYIRYDEDTLINSFGMINITTVIIIIILVID